MPWYVFLFVGALDFGFYSYSLISLEDGVRVAALNASRSSSLASDSGSACTYVLGSIKNLPNIGTTVLTCSAAPVTVTASYGATSGPDGGPSTTVTAIYVTPQMVPIPGLLAGQLTITRSVQMRVRS
jgi:Flp pilus assembly protein TadG